jgi:hypothetical protein
VSPAKRLFLILSAISVGVIVVSLGLFYAIGESGPLPLKDVLYGMVDLSVERGPLDDVQIEAYLESVGWTSERLDATMNNMADTDPEVFWELIGGLESYAQQKYGVSLWELGLG